MSKQTEVFAYKGFIGILSNPSHEGIIAHPGNGNLGVVMDASKVRISNEALTLLKSIKKGRDCIGDIDVFTTNDNKVIFSWLGGYMNIVKANEIVGSREYDPSHLKAYNGEINVPSDFIEAVDEILKIENN